MSDDSNEDSGRNFLYWIVPAAGFFLGYWIGAIVLSFLTGLAFFVALVFLDEKLTSKRKTEGFFLRNRGAFLEFLVSALGIFIGLGFGEWGWIVGYFIGMTAGSWISNKLGWSQDVVLGKLEVMMAYVGVLSSAAFANGTISDKEKKEISEACRSLFSTLGLGDDEAVSNAVSGAIAEPVGADVAAAYVATLPDSLKQAIQSDVLRILFCDGDLTTSAEQWLAVFVGQSGIADWALLHLYTRTFLSDDGSRAQWLQELELPPAATEEQIRSAYRTKALDYHPDKLQHVPPQIRALAEAKMMSINQAYQNLTKSNGHDENLYISGGEGQTTQMNGRTDVVVSCWICAQRNRIPHKDASLTARCGKCHALLGTTFDPNKK